MIRLEHVSKTYQQGVPALNDVNIDIEQGEFVFIMGKSGSGKSTLIKLLLKELEPTEGEIYINEQKLSSVTHKKTPYFRRNIGVVFQNFRLLQDRNVYENVAFAMKVVESSTREIKRKVPLMLFPPLQHPQASFQSCFPDIPLLFRRKPSAQYAAHDLHKLLLH